MNYSSELKYFDRKSKAGYVFDKYKDNLYGRILDVGSDQCYLKSHLPEKVDYIGIDINGNPDVKVDLNRNIPFKNQEFNCVLCLDVLEHLDNPHFIFDECCRVSSNYVIISLPNPWNAVYHAFLGNRYNQTHWIKFYGLPPEPDVDRHKWFFSPDEAEKFISFRAKLNHFSIEFIDYENDFIRVEKWFSRIIRTFFSEGGRGFLDHPLIMKGTLWAIIKRNYE